MNADGWLVVVALVMALVIVDAAGAVDYSVAGCGDPVVVDPR